MCSLDSYCLAVRYLNNKTVTTNPAESFVFFLSDMYNFCFVYLLFFLSVLPESYQRTVSGFVVFYIIYLFCI